MAHSGKCLVRPIQGGEIHFSKKEREVSLIYGTFISVSGNLLLKNQVCLMKELSDFGSIIRNPGEVDYDETYDTKCGDFHGLL